MTLLTASNRLSRLTSLSVAFAILVSGCASSGGNRASQDVMNTEQRAFSGEELEAGRIIHQQLTSSFYVYTEPKTIQYVQEVGKSLTGGPDGSPDPWLFTVLYNEKIYATSAPGGYVYVTTGLLNFLENEAELAGVLAYEVGRLQFRPASLGPESSLLRDTTNTVAMVAPAFGQIGLLAALGMIALVAVADSQGSEPPTKEEQLSLADDMAMRYMIKSGYDPQAWIDLQYRLLRSKKIAPLFYEYYESHPITEARFMHLNEAFQNLPLENKSLATRRKRFAELTRGVREIYRV